MCHEARSARSHGGGGSQPPLFGIILFLSPKRSRDHFGAFLSPLAGLGGEGAATVAGIMLAALCVAGLPCVLLIAGRRADPKN